MYFQRFFSMDELIRSIEAVTAEELTQLAQQYFQPDHIAVTVLGNLNGLKISREQLEC
jgi:predicted Zn-dependent peptidase